MGIKEKSNKIAKKCILYVCKNVTNNANKSLYE